MPLTHSDFQQGDRVTCIKWGKFSEPDSEYIGAKGTVIRVKNDFVEVKLDNDPIKIAESCPFWPSELEHIKEEATH